MSDNECPSARHIPEGEGGAHGRACTDHHQQTLLHEGRLVRMAAASLAFNVGAWVQKGWVARIKGGEVVDGTRADEEDGECVAEALAGEEESEDAGELSVPLWSPPSAISITDGPKESMMLNFFISGFT